MDVRYPIGKYIPQPFSVDLLRQWVNEIAALPQQIEEAVINLDENQLNTPYRPDGWTVKQLVHHVADSHMNAYIRFKLALTEDNPTIKPYREDLWAELSDTQQLPINISVTILYAVHIRWVAILKNIKMNEWDRAIIHPEHQQIMSLWYLLGMYAWHGKHHVAHITALRVKNSW